MSQIVNSCVLPISWPYITGQPIFAANGLVTNIFFIALFNMLLPIARFIDPFNILLKYREKYYSDPGTNEAIIEKRLLDLKGQTELNRIFTFYEF